MGKTTLCKQLAHAWAQGAHKEWEAVYVLPVRALQAAKYDALQDHRLARAIAHTCFAQAAPPPELVTRIAQQLQSPQTLVVLDGWDEQQGASEPLLAEALDGKQQHK